MAESTISAVIATGGKQYLVHEGDEVLVEKLPEQKTISFKSLSDGKTVTASVVEQAKGEKLVVFKMRAKKRSRKKAGHRQALTKLRIDKIGA